MTRPSYTPSHVGLCVADLARSLRFWCDGLGFEKAETFDVGAEFGPSLEVDGDVAVTSQFIRRDAMAIELLAYASPGVTGKPSMNRNQLGLTHVSFVVEDLDAAEKHLVDCGGTVLENTRFADDPDVVQIIFLADPDGTRVELLRYPG